MIAGFPRERNSSTPASGAAEDTWQFSTAVNPTESENQYTGDAVYLHFASWSGEKEPLETDYDRGGEGKIDTESQLADE